MKAGVRIRRDEHGIPHIEAENITDMYYGQGYAHAQDRGLQMLLMRVLGKGRACELLNDSEEMLKIDIFFRKMNWHGNIGHELEKLGDEEKEILSAYCKGINAAFAEKCPWEFKLLGYKPEEWTEADTLMMSRMIGYLTLAQSQAEIERLFVEMVQAGVAKDKLEELFPGILGGLDIELLKKVTLRERIVPSNLLWNIAAPRMMASNNWVISGEKTASGKPIVANDPHLEVNRVPNVWYEIVLKCKDRYAMGGSMPGVPGILTGRNPDVAWGVTYAFCDAIDSWIEKCKDGKYYQEDEDKWGSFYERKEVIKRKKHKPLEVIFYENRHGVLDGDPHQEGYYLCTRWAAGDSGADAVSAILGLWNSDSVKNAMQTIGKIETAWSFVFADTNGNIGFQMTGRIPRRREGISGFVPLPGWKKENDWQGFLDPEELPHAINPKEGFFVTANHDLNKHGKVNPINMPMGPYRANRINYLLKQKNNFTMSDMFHMQFDVYSLQAEYFMEILRPLLPNTPQGKILRDWDLKYDADSKGAYLFERFYQELYREVFGRNGFGEEVIDYLARETGTFVDFYENFDRILLSEKSSWFNGENREEIYKKVLNKVINVSPEKWGDVQKFTMSHILFGGKLPGFLGFDRGPFTGIGGRATIHQGQIYRSGGRVTTFMPSFRIVTDLSKDEVYTTLAGGPSDRRFSRWYCSDLKNWLKGKYKKISCN